MSSQSLLQNKTFLFTGTLTEFTRDEAESLVEANGGKVLSGVSAKLNYLVVGEDAGSKLDKAKKLGTVMIISEIEFLNLISNSDTQVPVGSNTTPKIESSIVIEKSHQKSISQKNTTENTETTPKNLPDNDIAVLGNTTKVNRKELSSIKKLLTSDSFELIETGLLMLSGLDDPLLIDSLLEGVNFLNFELIPNDIFSGSKNKQPLLNYALLGVLSLSNDKCLTSFPLKSKISELHIDLPNLTTLSQLKGIKRLVLSDSLNKLKNLDGIENMELLSGLVLKDCPEITSIEAIKNLPICEFDWGISRCIESLAPLKNKVDATQVKKLVIRDFYPLKSLDGIEFYQSLESLIIDDTQGLKDLSALRKLPSLEIVNGASGYSGWNYFNLRQLNSVEALFFQKQSNLKVYFDIWESESDSVFPDFKHLSFTCNNMPNLDWIKKFPNLVGLEITSSNLTDISGIVACPNLQGLILNSPVLEDISVIGGLSNLQALNISNCKKIESIEALKNLKTLKLFGDSFKDVIVVYSNKYIQQNLELFLSKSENVSTTLDIDELSSIPSLEALFSLEFLQGHIETLTCFKTSVLHAGEIAKFKKLKTIRIAECAVNDELLQELIQIEALVELRLVNCPVIDFRNKTKSNLNLIIDSSNTINIQNCTFKKLKLFHTEPKGFENCTFEELEIIGNNSMVNLNGIANLDVKSLGLYELNALTNADEIQQMKNLKHLSLRMLPVLSKIGFLAAMLNLEGLNTEECPLLEVKPKPKGLMTKTDLINYQLKIAVQLKLPIAKSIAEMQNQAKLAKTTSISRKEMSNVKKLLQSRDLSLIMSGVEIVASLNDEALCAELLEGIKYERAAIAPNKIFSGTGPAQPYLNTAMLGVLNAASKFKPWADFISGITKISMEVLVLDYLACLKQLQSLSVEYVCKSTVKLDLPELSTFNWRARGWALNELPATISPFDFNILEGSPKLEKITIGSSLDISGNLDCFSNFTLLKELDLTSINQNQLTTLKPLADCKSLEILLLNFYELGKIATLDGLEGAESLRVIRIYNSAIQDTSALKGLKNVEKLEITSPVLEHFTPCEDFSKLTTLNFHSSTLLCGKLSTFYKGRYPEKMKEINLEGTAIKKLPEFTNLKSIDDLNLSHTPIVDLSSIKTIKRIGALDLSDCKEIVDFKDFVGVEEIHSISVKGCTKLVSFKGMEGVKLNNSSMRFSECPALQSLEDLRPIKWDSLGLRMEKLPKINPSIECDRLRLEYTKSLEGIGTFKNLKELILSNGDSYKPEYPLEDYSQLTEIPNLKKLIIFTDKPLPLGNLAHFKHLEVLCLVGCTHLSDPEKLEHVHIDKLYIAGCNLKKADFPDTLQDKIDWQSKPY